MLPLSQKGCISDALDYAVAWGGGVYGYLRSALRAVIGGALNSHTVAADSFSTLKGQTTRTNADK